MLVPSPTYSFPRLYPVHLPLEMPMPYLLSQSIVPKPEAIQAARLALSHIEVTDVGLPMPWRKGWKRQIWLDPWPPRTTGRTWRAWWSGAEQLLLCSLMALMCQPHAVRCVPFHHALYSLLCNHHVLCSWMLHGCIIQKAYKFCGLLVEVEFWPPLFEFMPWDMALAVCLV